MEWRMFFVHIRKPDIPDITKLNTIEFAQSERISNNEKLDANFFMRLLEYMHMQHLHACIISSFSGASQRPCLFSIEFCRTNAALAGSKSRSHVRPKENPLRHTTIP